METKTTELSDKDQLVKQYEDAKFQLTTLRNVLENLFVVNSSGIKKLRAGVKEKDIEMVSVAIIKIKSSLLDIANELKVMEERQGAIETQHAEARNGFVELIKETGIKLPKFLSGYYQIDG